MERDRAPQTRYTRESGRGRKGEKRGEREEEGKRGGKEKRREMEGDERK